MTRVIISLGDDCTPSIAMRNFFKLEPSSCFDWLITPTNALIDILNTRGEYFGLRIGYAMNGKSIVCKSYGCFYHHEFSRDENEHCIITPEDLKNCREKLIYKYEKMIGLCTKENNPLFIRNIHSAMYPENGDNFIYTEKTILKIYKALENAVGHNSFNLLFTTIGNSEFKDRLVENCELVNTGKVQCLAYDGDHSEEDINFFWKKIF